MRFFTRRKNNVASCGYILAVIMAFFAVMTCHAAESDNVSVRDAFVNIQSPAIDILKKTTRLDMLDYWDADSVYKAQNAMEGLSWLEAAGDTFLKVRVSPVSTYELKILPLKKGKVIMGIYTVGGESQAMDSQIDFYDSNLNKLDASRYFKAPDLQAFFDIPKGALTSMKEIREMIPFPTVAYSAEEYADNVTARLTVSEYMDVDNYNIIKIFLKPQIILQWDGSRYKYKK